jgi:alpha-mannosidase
LIFVVRVIPAGAQDLISSLKAPFVVEGARNVFLETVKRGEYDSFESPANLDDKSTTTTIVLRLYEAFGGHAQANLRISDHLPVVKAFTTNLLEDEDEELYILRAKEDGDNSGTILSLNFRGFEVKTVKLVLADLAYA